MKHSVALCSLVVILLASACSQKDEETISLVTPKGWKKPTAIAQSGSWEQDYYSPVTEEPTAPSAQKSTPILKVKAKVTARLSQLREKARRLARKGSRKTKLARLR